MSWINRENASLSLLSTPLDEASDAPAAFGNAVFGDDAIARISTAPARGMLIVRGDLQGKAMANAVRAVINGDPPAIRRCETNGETGVYWMSPDALLLCMPYTALAEAYHAVISALKGSHHLVTDSSDARQIFIVSGANARTVLAKGAPVDFHPDAFGAGDLRRTRIGELAAMIAQVGERPDQFEVFVLRSYAAHMWRWLTVAAAPGGEVGYFHR